jgi:hypothetical protein
MLPGHVSSFVLLVSVVVWSITVLGIFLVSFWLVEVLVLSAPSIKKSVYGADDVQVRVLTVADVATVRETVERLDDDLEEVRIIAEEDMDVEGAQVHVVPDSFSCEADKKGRALEWANRNIETRKEFVLYLDEDSHMENFAGLPDRDMVQLREKPRYTGSVIAYVADVFRMGVQLEQLSFPNFRLPLFAWGGGIAIKREAEKEVGWNRKSIVEDTAFVWRAASEGYSFGISDIYVRNEAPPSIMALLRQRRRWAGGNHSEAKALAQPYRSFQRIRNFGWGLTPMSAFVIPLMLFLVSPAIIYEDLLQVIGIFLFMVAPVWYLLGVAYYREFNPLLLPGLLLAYPASIIHGIGALWGIAKPPRTFEVTPKQKK